VGEMVIYVINEIVSFESMNGWLNDLHILCTSTEVFLFLHKKCDKEKEWKFSENEVKGFA
jgi:hypothetical protein